MMTYTEKDLKQDLQLIKNSIDYAFERIIGSPDPTRKYLSNEMLSDLLELKIRVKTAANETIEVIEKVDMMRSQETKN
jgi:hypothetical protein